MEVSRLGTVRAVTSAQGRASRDVTVSTFGVLQFRPLRGKEFRSKPIPEFLILQLTDEETPRYREENCLNNF